MTSGESDFRKAEYDNLYKEILDNSTKLYGVIAACVTVTGGLLAWIFKPDEKGSPLPADLHPVLILLPLVVILPSALLVRSCLGSTARIAAYLTVKYEGKSDEISWQKDMQQWRTNHRSSMLRGVMGVFIALMAVCIVASLSVQFRNAGDHLLREVADVVSGIYISTAIALSPLIWHVLKSWLGRLKLSAQQSQTSDPAKSTPNRMFAQQAKIVLDVSLALVGVAVVSAAFAWVASNDRGRHIEYGVLVSGAFGLSSWILVLLNKTWKPDYFENCIKDWRAVLCDLSADDTADSSGQRERGEQIRAAAARSGSM